MYTAILQTTVSKLALVLILHYSTSHFRFNTNQFSKRSYHSLFQSNEEESINQQNCSSSTVLAQWTNINQSTIMLHLRVLARSVSNQTIVLWRDHFHWDIGRGEGLGVVHIITSSNWLSANKRYISSIAFL